MPNAPKTQHRQVRLDKERWGGLEVAAPLLGAKDRSDYIRQCIDWALRRPGARRPGRLTEDQARSLFGNSGAVDAELQAVVDREPESGGGRRAP